MEIGRAGESCAFYIAKSLGMPADMLRRASQAAYGENGSPDIMDALPEQLERRSAPVIQKEKIHKNHQTEADAFRLGDCVMVYPDKRRELSAVPQMKRACFRFSCRIRKYGLTTKG